MKTENKKITVKQIHTESNDPDLMYLSELLDEMDNAYKIGIPPWPNYPYRPEVKFKIAYTHNEILLKVYVKENFIRAKYDQPNDPVYCDSCFEFFFSPDNNDSYYNFEFNCIGTPYLAFGKSGNNREKADATVAKSIWTFSSLGNQIFKEKSGKFEWEMCIAIPFKAFFKHDLKNLKGKHCSVNFYKCGDELTKSHFLAWNKIETKNPDFHRPEFFGEITFM